MSVHYFHCTDGADLIVDRTGREVDENDDAALRTARTVADEIMNAVPSFGEWDSWAVHVYDGSGERAVVPFLRSVAG